MTNVGKLLSDASDWQYGRGASKPVVVDGPERLKGTKECSDCFRLLLNVGSRS